MARFPTAWVADGDPRRNVHFYAGNAGRGHDPSLTVLIAASAMQGMGTGVGA